MFLINVPVAVLVLLLTTSPRLESSGQERKIDLIPHVLLALCAATFAITQAGQLNWIGTTLSGCAAVVLLTLAGIRNRVSVSPIVPAALRGNTTVWATFAWGAAANYLLTAILFALPLTLHKSPTIAGLTLLPMTIVMAFNPVLTGRIVARRGPALAIRMGLSALTVGAVVLVFGFSGGHNLV